ncbi:Putative phosphatidate cytidylyltransferase; AltName: Full=CDP-DAG synthase; AltName: Full=CDP-DG synthase; AltName: Full=CDP-diacylglycerol synthase; Short=CDS; AltName: Full=CDP-diglyceride pyrophosphorylase; AltName: Full=CDP-diglyceride synthase; AltName: Full=CTP:phosphatidate cytidylyltransferase [Serendipita indica DSM 11827]|uniref:Phosphatidate cytidylyltransferase n=1 Tax=Serendipita indica (strain DSM 11827) TaxID=1109443 RepID=G4TAI7_SERID|nr:Putative phosphatidate cytidylyltransferase; AltName: Full=CDP-DAG synthase; AltName: Full=CDP-DG synthase; AltName: Full=CDP-diacylglycerol synthase; Short=CDS; AltName: Full=CDP-diglyceride pyrophosphorylase; AltName: Full=CDP-diglyceride synthase; AltName: Full=CTP:phosphatidate cytidylyltransferase [Serendipita indica DSM 11827]CCA68311.1 related to CDS1-CDP-diacylglycerol synthase [Serendipita indica DSM 11827]
MSSRRPDYQSKFSSKGAFDTLTVEDLPSEEEEDAPVIVEPEAPAPPEPAPVVETPKPLTKAQQKKAAKASKREQQKVPSPIVTKDPLPAPERTSPTRENSLGAGPSTPLPQPIPLRARSRSPPGSISIPAEPAFTPNLPNDLPHPSQKLVRKRKASTDLSAANSKESKVEIEVENVDSHEKVTSIPVTVDVSSSAPAGITPEGLKKRKDTGNRIMSGLVLIGGFLGLLLAGHIYMIMLVVVIQSLVFREITQLFQGIRDPWSKTLNWYFFAIANYYFYGETIIYYLKHVLFSEAVFHPFAANHRFISFMLYVFGFMGFVASLKKNYLQRQFSLFGWVHMTLLVVVVSSHFIVDNILEGMIWFWLPASLVICNDIFAWFWGVTLGRTQLFALSPKKTVEGFVGAFFSTLIFGFFWASFFMRYDYMICPVKDLGASAFSGLTCKPNPVFVWRDFKLTQPAVAIASFLAGRTVTTIPWAPFQFHALMMATFASLVAPFGGFFASGFKRAFNIKDFGHSIPGHGGMTDRMDCQFLMGMFSYVYYSNLIRVNEITVASVMQAIVNGLSRDEQMQLLGELKRLIGSSAGTS